MNDKMMIIENNVTTLEIPSISFVGLTVQGTLLIIESSLIPPVQGTLLTIESSLIPPELLCR